MYVRAMSWQWQLQSSSTVSSVDGDLYLFSSCASAHVCSDGDCRNSCTFGSTTKTDNETRHAQVDETGYIVTVFSVSVTMAGFVSISISGSAAMCMDATAARLAVQRRCMTTPDKSARRRVVMSTMGRRMDRSSEEDNEDEAGAAAMASTGVTSPLCAPPAPGLHHVFVIAKTMGISGGVVKMGDRVMPVLSVVGCFHPRSFGG